MTTREAIKRIVEHNKIHFEKEKGKCPLITKALEMAVEALEKQIPKKPIYVENITLTDVFKCPCCKKTVYRNIYSKILLSLRTGFGLER